ncbi:CDP-alcohol phosphatidyltransferase family protein [Novosphingobium sp. JCM 18896]|uniref:CDP-alcohol phosphatidyltransferase family protein n=1 Tax=Novosphingobium sp. JCM 18896 TaxID=2989731 RepID=UPI0022220AF1|nr:CDP-alcohol phosphatidyltransferase family protein [Novosphingobium sp. JCM 18896]MCW1429414.1 CDP-alcohol phosphatidyltransferase family protein [Novosphingobium sp. JCM 18896]
MSASSPAISPDFSVAIPTSPFLRQRMGGLTGIGRSVILADLVGARTIYVVSSRAEPIDWPRSFALRERPLPEVVFVADAGEIPAQARLVMLPADRLLTQQGLRRLVEDPAAALDAPGDGFGPGAPDAVTWQMLQASMKPSEGWFGRHLNRPISFRMAAWLMRRDVSPNAVTWATFAIAVVMTVLLAHGGLWWLAIGGLLYQVVSVVDCVDGDIARVSHQNSRSGAVLDTGFDMLANLGFAGGLTVGLVRTYGMGQLQVAGAMVVIAALCMSLMALLVRLGPRRGSFDVLRQALALRLASTPRLATVVLTAEKLFKRDFYALFAACLCLAGIPWLVPQLALGGICIWLAAILWCAPVIIADKSGDLLPAHLKA